MFALERLREAPLLDSASTISTGDGLRAFLSHRPEVIELRSELNNGTITPEDIRDFVRRLLSEFDPGRQFSGEVVLAGIAVALESYSNSFSDQFLRDLSALQIKEMPLAPRVAKLALKERRKLIADLTVKDKVFSYPEIDPNTRPLEIYPQPIATG